MAIIEFVLLSDPPSASVYTISRSISKKSIMQLRQRVREGKPLVEWETDDFPLTKDRQQHYSEILLDIEAISSCNCEFQLYYRITPDDDREEISHQQLINLLESDIEYENQERD